MVEILEFKNTERTFIMQMLHKPWRDWSLHCSYATEINWSRKHQCSPFVRSSSRSLLKGILCWKEYTVGKIYCLKEYWLKILELRYIVASPYGICYLLHVTYYRRSTQFFGRREGERKFWDKMSHWNLFGTSTIGRHCIRYLRLLFISRNASSSSTSCIEQSLSINERSTVVTL